VKRPLKRYGAPATTWRKQPEACIAAESGSFQAVWNQEDRVHRVARFFGRLAEACAIDWHEVLHELAAVLPNADGAVSPHCFRAIITSLPVCDDGRSGVSGDE
jgi:hypothetical protein